MDNVALADNRDADVNDSSVTPAKDPPRLDARFIALSDLRQLIRSEGGPVAYVPTLEDRVSNLEMVIDILTGLAIALALILFLAMR